MSHKITAPYRDGKVGSKIVFKKNQNTAVHILTNFASYRFIKLHFLFAHTVKAHSLIPLRLF